MCTSDDALEHLNGNCILAMRVKNRNPGHRHRTMLGGRWRKEGIVAVVVPLSIY